MVAQCWTIVNRSGKSIGNFFAHVVSKSGAFLTCDSVAERPLDTTDMHEVDHPDMMLESMSLRYRLSLYMYIYLYRSISVDR
jgi:hypothetical protein